MRKLPAVSFVAALFFAGGCYTYVPTARTVVTPGAEVRAILTVDGVEEMRGYFGPGVTSVSGPLVSWDQEGMGVLAKLSLQREGYPATVMTDTLHLLPPHLARVALRRSNGKRTAGFTVAVMGVAAAAILAPRVFGGGSEDSGEGPGPEAAIILRIPFGIGFR